MEQDVGPAEPADAAAAFEALRREVALLNVAVAGLAAERTPAPDYSETLGEIARGVSVAVGRLGKVMTSPAFALSSADLVRQIAAAGDEVGRQDHAAVHQAQEALQRSARDLDEWIDRARLASVQNWRIMQAVVVGVVGGMVLYSSVPTIIVNAAPVRWAWPEKRAASIWAVTCGQPVSAYCWSRILSGGGSYRRRHRFPAKPRSAATRFLRGSAQAPTEV